MHRTIMTALLLALPSISINALAHKPNEPTHQIYPEGDLALPDWPRKSA